MDTYLVAECAQYLSRYAKQAECRLLLSLILFVVTISTGYITLDAPMRAMTRYEGETLRIKCEITGSPLPTYVWRKNGVPLSELAAKADHFSAKTTLWGSR